MSLRLNGILGPVVTTFDPTTGELDRDAFATNIRTHIEAGLRGVVICGSTGEAALLEERERMALVETAREVVPTESLLIVGTGAESTRTTQRYTRLAAERGADAVLVIAPHYYGAKAMSASALRGHYMTIADTSPVPVLLYNMPKYMHFALSPQLVAELAQHQNIVGMKDSSGDVELLSAYLKAQTEAFAVLTGNGSTVKWALNLGAKGAIVTVALFATALALEVYASIAEGAGGPEAAEQAQGRLTPLSTRIVGELGVPGVKAALDQIGLRGGPPRPPLLPASAAEVSEVAQLLRAAELSLAA